jgi:long-chain acyl-CoA synthetase
MGDQVTGASGCPVDVSQLRCVGDIVRFQAKQRGSATAFKFEGRVTSYARLDLHSSAVAQGLIASGVRPGDRIAYFGKNSDLYFEVLLGTVKAGAVITPINWRLAAREITHIVTDASVKVLFVAAEFVAAIKAIAPESLGVKLVVTMDQFERWRDSYPSDDPLVPVAEDDIAFQLYTSGTTGQPKGAMLSHRAIVGMRHCVANADLEWNRWTPDDVGLLAMPVGHIAGTGWGITSLYNGATSIIAREFNPRDVLDFVERDRISKLFLVPAALQIIVRDPRARSTDFSQLKCIFYGASPIPLALLAECMDVFGCGFAQQYGMTETCGTIVVLPPEDHTPEGSPKMRSAGKPLRGVEIAILDEAGSPVPTGSVGEIATRSIGNMSGYWNLPAATASVLSADGWLRTGDAGYVDAEGYVYIHDRVKDMIISGGENIYPAEVENAIFGHPDVADVAVIGVPDEKWGEAVKALVVAAADSSPDAADIIAWTRQRIAPFKAPKSVDFVKALPRNPSGKILRRELREPFWSAIGRRVN